MRKVEWIDAPVFLGQGPVVTQGHEYSMTVHATGACGTIKVFPDEDLTGVTRTSSTTLDGNCMEMVRGLYEGPTTALPNPPTAADLQALGITRAILKDETDNLILMDVSAPPPAPSKKKSSVVPLIAAGAIGLALLAAFA